MGRTKGLPATGCGNLVFDAAAINTSISAVVTRNGTSRQVICFRVHTNALAATSDPSGDTEPQGRMGYAGGTVTMPPCLSS